MKPQSKSCLAAALCAAAITAASAQVTVDGGDDGSEGYSQLAVQDVLTGWDPAIGNKVLANLSAVQDGGDLALFVGGRADGNAIILFIDSKAGGNSFIPNNLIVCADGNIGY
jgi:hypothetical protein